MRRVQMRRWRHSLAPSGIAAAGGPAARGQPNEREVKPRANVLDPDECSRRPAS